MRLVMGLDSDSVNGLTPRFTDLELDELTFNEHEDTPNPSQFRQSLSYRRHSSSASMVSMAATQVLDWDSGSDEEEEEDIYNVVAEEEEECVLSDFPDGDRESMDG